MVARLGSLLPVAAGSVAVQFGLLFQFDDYLIELGAAVYVAVDYPGAVLVVAQV
jgi:hypothetical protein